MHATIQELHQQLSNLQNNKLVDKLMHFGSCLRGTRAYWTKWYSKLTNMINQLGFPTLFFTLSVAHTKWPDLHTIMPLSKYYDQQSEHARNIQNVIQYPHIFSMYMHQRFNVFHDIVLKRYLCARDFWYRFGFLLFQQFYNDLKENVCCCVFLSYFNCTFSILSSMSGIIEVPPISTVFYGFLKHWIWKHWIGPMRFLLL